ncbi:hypothetical protein VaNZ11_003936 [Volvox africanus]|uniref:Uncharacterized protein n=1 Tax=Volvox africanus TaxID=51714 RepID=A0ABQ5RVB1_9CHLO|nr:hypothetical protein VaNZ11_003936 [Volvox africanus]
MTSQQFGQPPKAKKQKREKPVLEPLPDDGHPGHSKLARALASNDFQTREKGLYALKTWMLRKTDLNESDMIRIWKGLFYCFWHSDKAPVQAELAERLAAMLTQLPEQTAYLFFTAFMSTIRREWFGIDRLRMDKFMMLIRKFIHSMLACLKASKWQADLVQRYAEYLHHHVLVPSDNLLAAGVAYHCGDVLLDELRGVANGKAIPASALSSLLEPFTAALQNGEQAALQRIGDGIFDTLLSELASPTNDSHYLQKLDVAGLAAQLFDKAAAPNTRGRNRRVLHDLSRALEKLQRKRQRVDEGAQAGPSSQTEPTAKPTKKQLKEKRMTGVAASAATTAPIASSAANGDVGRPEDAEGAKGRTSNLKVATSMQQQSTMAAGGANNQNGSKPNGKKKQRVQENGGTAGGLGASTAGGPSDPELAVKAGANCRTVGILHKEPTSGQKAALRAAVAKLSASLDVDALPAQKSTKPKKSLGAAQQDQPEVTHTTNPQPASTLGLSVLGKRPALWNNAKAGPVTAQEPQQQGSISAAGVQTPTQLIKDGKEGGRAGATTTAKKGRVVINLKKNLYFEHGGPVPDPDVRTPPPARAKGGILKKTARSCPPKLASLNASTLTAKQRQQKPATPTARVLPKQARRASAALFF